MAKAKPDQNNNFLTLDDQLFHAARVGDLNTMEKLIAQGADIDYTEKSSQGFDDYYTPVIVIAALNHEFEAVKLLVEKNAEINVERDILSLVTVHQAPDSSPLMQAIITKRDDIVEFLLNKNASPNYLSSYKKYDTSPLHKAIYEGRTEIVKLLLEHKANPYLKNFQGENALESLNSTTKFLEECRLSKEKQEAASLIENLLVEAMSSYEHEVTSVEIIG